MPRAQPSQDGQNDGRQEPVGPLREEFDGLHKNPFMTGRVICSAPAVSMQKDRSRQGFQCCLDRVRLTAMAAAPEGEKDDLSLRPAVFEARLTKVRWGFQRG